MTRKDVLSGRTRPANLPADLPYDIPVYAHKEFGCGSGNGYEPELIRQMKEIGRNPLAQHSYLNTLDGPASFTRTKNEVGALIHMVETGIEYLSQKGRSTRLLEKRLDELKEEYPSQFASQNGRPSEPRNPATKNLRSSQYDK